MKCRGSVRRIHIVRSCVVGHHAQNLNIVAVGQMRVKREVGKNKKDVSVI